MKLTSDRLIFRPWTQEDAGALYALASDPELGPACGWQPHRNPEESRKTILLRLSGEHDFALTLKETGELAGCVSLYKGSTCDRDDFELGYWLGRPYWGQGLMTEAARRMMKYAFTQLESPRLWVAHAVGNEASRRVIEKLRFRREFLKEEILVALGERRLTYYYSRYRAEERRGGE